MEMMPPKTKYALSGDISIAYQVIGDGPLDLVVVPGWISHLDMMWDVVGYPEWIEGLTRFARVIVFDKRGTGLSDRDVGDSTLEDRMDDLRAVLDDVGSERAAIFGLSEGGALAMLFAAAYPERVHGLVLFGTLARVQPAPDYPAGVEQLALFRRMQDVIANHWGEGRLLEWLSPEVADNPIAIEFMGRFERAAASPRAATKHLEWCAQLDVRPVAKALRVPTLILHRVDDGMVVVECGRWLAENIVGAQYIERPGKEHQPWSGNFAQEVDDMQQFLTGSSEPVETERVLATVLFTDIVASTERASAMGDRAWRALLDRHHAMVREEIRRHRGVERNTTGDGFFATFDGPARAVRCAAGLRDAVKRLELEVRAGVHTGECERAGDDLAGIAVNTGARVMAAAGAGEIFVSGTVKDLVVGSGLEFGERGVHELKGVPGSWPLFALV
ncbi:MAG: class 3 adenylate cyclase [Hyphomicrobiaceae bacterium]|jgi:class 3 adenylate cyclase